MNTAKKVRTLFFTAFVAGTTVAGTLGGPALAADLGVDLERVQRDVSIMSGILRTTFDEACRECRGSIEAQYLAKQGAVFTVAPSHNYFRHIADGSSELAMSFDDWEFEGLSDLAEIPAMVNEIVQGLDIDVDADGRYISIGASPYVDRETRHQLRDLRREQRDLTMELSEVEIEMIHAGEDEKRVLEERLAQLNEQLLALSGRHEEMEADLSERHKAHEKKRLEAREEVRKRREARFMHIEKLTLHTMCDYGANLKNIPSSEHVSIILENANGASSDASSRVYVFKKKDLVSCEATDSDKIKQMAIVYNF